MVQKRSEFRTVSTLFTNSSLVVIRLLSCGKSKRKRNISIQLYEFHEASYPDEYNIILII